MKKKMDYDKDVENDAVNFIEEHEDEIKEAIADQKEFDGVGTRYGDIRDAFHEAVIDVAYSPSDAVYILESCENEETDSGLWEGKDWRDELSAIAAYSFGNDVWFKCEEIYKELKERVSELIYEFEDDLDGSKEEFDEAREEAAITQAWKEFVAEHTTKSIEKDSEEERELLQRWLALSKDASWWAGYPIGSSYIDARCGTGHGMPDVKDFVDFDHEIAQKLPWMQGKRKDDVEMRLDELNTKLKNIRSD
jgi:hypothetical protein